MCMVAFFAFLYNGLFWHFFFFFSSRRRHTRSDRDWSSDVCSSDLDPDALQPFSLEEMAAKYRHRGLAAALGNPAIAFAEGRCVGGSTEINSGLYHRLPAALAESWRHEDPIDHFTPQTLRSYPPPNEKELTVFPPPG